ncbi:penicillin-binding transpeptidase domain-containing protein [Propionibacteriaceae bacterium Y1923]
MPAAVAVRTTARLRWVAVLVALSVVLAGCSRIGLDQPEEETSTTGVTHGQPPEGEPDAVAVAEALAQALQTGDLSAVPFVGDPATAPKAAADDYATIMSGMDGFTPQVTLQPIEYKGNGVAQVSLEQTYSMGAEPWTFTSVAGLNLVAGQWRVVWRPSIVHEQVTATTRLRHTRELPARAPILDAQGKAVMESRDLSQVGLDKQNTPPNQWSDSARRIAEAMGIDVAAYQRKVAAHGPRAFVLAVTVRRSEVPEAIATIPGAITLTEQGTVAVTNGFAASLLGTVGKVTEEQAKASNGALEVGDQIGLTGLQARYDEQLRGTAGHLVMLVKRRDAPSPGPSDEPHVDLTLFAQDPVEGEPLQTSLDTGWQHRAQGVLANETRVAAIVAVNWKTGGVLAAAESPAAKGQPYSTFGQYEPGSTFKTVTALAMVRQGLSAQTMVDCPATTVVNGRSFKNYSDYPSSKIGRITLADAFAHSCNTAFIRAAADLPDGALAEAAASLGFGVDFDAGFPVFYGQVPATDDPVVNAANAIGQGRILASPLAIAGIGASIAGGKTVIPWLVAGHEPTSTAPPLSQNETAQLQALMKATVASGSASSLAGVVTGAKTGTAEWGNQKPPQTHAWMVVYQGDLAIAVLVAGGSSGSADAAPLVRAFLR